MLGSDVVTPLEAASAPPARTALAALRAAISGASTSREDRQSTTESDPAASSRDMTRLGAILDALDERAFGLALLLLALPCCLPFVYLLPQIVALPMLALAAQLAAGRLHPWLPTALADRPIDRASFLSVVDRSERYVGWFERLARPRLLALSRGVGLRVVGALLIVPCASILVPLPATNTAPGIGVAIAALGIVERDGFLILLGLAAGLAWVAILAIFGLEAASLIKAWISARL